MSGGDRAAPRGRGARRPAGEGRRGGGDTVLIVAAHPDDEVLGCGGTVARLAAEGHDPYIAILGEGVTSRYAKRRQADRAMVEALRQQCRAAASTIGARDLFLYDLPDNRFDTLPLLEVVKIVEALIARLRPRVLYTHHPGDLNVDHCVTFRAALTAARPVPGCAVRELYTFETPSSTEWSFGGGQRFNPTVFVDIGATLPAKLAALALYDGEVRPFPHPRSNDAVTAIARRWGSVAGVHAAEVFELIRKVC